MTFKELEFKDHPNKSFGGWGTMATHDFPNGYGISVITGSSAYCGDNTYEVAIIKDGSICYNTPLTDDVLADQSEDDIDNILTTLEKM